jgi:hypothetical protein
MDNKPSNSNKNESKSKDPNKKRKLLLHYQLGMILHLNFGMHILLLLIVNFFLGGITYGLSSRFYPIISLDSIEAFIVAIVLFTLIEVFIKGLMVRYLYTYVLMSFGVMFYLSNLLAFWLVDLTIAQVSFLYDSANIFIFTFIFMMIRILFTKYVRGSKWIQGGISHGI